VLPRFPERNSELPNIQIFTDISYIELIIAVLPEGGVINVIPVLMFSDVLLWRDILRFTRHMGRLSTIQNAEFQ
jgi:hypothetical protein